MASKCALVVVIYSWLCREFESDRWRKWKWTYIISDQCRVQVGNEGAANCVIGRAQMAVDERQCHCWTTAGVKWTVCWWRDLADGGVGAEMVEALWWYVGRTRGVCWDQERQMLGYLHRHLWVREGACQKYLLWSGIWLTVYRHWNQDGTCCMSISMTQCECEFLQAETRSEGYITRWQKLWAYSSMLFLYMSSLSVIQI